MCRSTSPRRPKTGRSPRQRGPRTGSTGLPRAPPRRLRSLPGRDPSSARSKSSDRRRSSMRPARSSSAQTPHWPGPPPPARIRAPPLPIPPLPTNELRLTKTSPPSCSHVAPAVQRPQHAAPVVAVAGRSVARRSRRRRSAGPPDRSRSTPSRVSIPPSVSGVQFPPASSDLQTPPWAPPTKRMFGSVGWMAIVDTRPANRPLGEKSSASIRLGPSALQRVSRSDKAWAGPNPSASTSRSAFCFRIA